jgi:hypothetical protein
VTRLAVAAVMICVALVGREALAQAPAADDTIRTDSVRQGSEPSRRTRPPIIEGLVLMPVAPASLVFLVDKTEQDFPPLGFWESRLAAHVAGGVAFAYSEGDTWAYSASVEILTHGIYGEVRSEYFRLPEYYYYRTVRVGYLLHPVPEVAGGVTLGYRDARRVSGHSGLEIGLPFITGSREWWLRYEAAYVMSTKAASWNYRFQGELLIRGGPLYVGAAVEGKTLPLRAGSKVSSIPVTLVVGVRP